MLQVRVQRRGAGECPLLAATMSLGMSGRRVAFAGAFTLDVGGLSFRHEDRTAFSAVNSLEMAATHCGRLSFTGRT